MKKQIILLAMMLLPMVAGAQGVVEIDSICYELVSKAKQAIVTNKTSGYYSGSVVIPESINYNGAEYSVTSIGNVAFRDCSGLTSITIPGSVTSIGDWAFQNCSGLTSITIPNSVTSIGEGAFYVCSGLTSVTIPNSVTGIGNYAFQYCRGLASATIGSSVTSIGNSAFSGCSGLTSVTIGNSVTNIGHLAFYECSALTSVTIGSSVKYINSRAFAYCKDLTDVYCLAEKVPSTYADAFQDSYVNYATLHVPAASINDYKVVEPWKYFQNFKTLEEQQLPKCSTPTISFDKSGLVFSCETSDVEYTYEIKSTDIKKGVAEGNRVELTPVYTITYYSMKAGYENSDVATATIRWRNGSPVFQGFSRVDPGEGAVWGDVNVDGAVDIADIANIIDIMAGK